MVKLTVKRLHKMLSCKPYMYWGVKQTTECLNFFLVEYKRHVIYVSVPVVVQLNINYRIESVNIVILLYQKQDSNMYIIFVYYQFLYINSFIY